MKAPDYLDAPAQAKWAEVFPILKLRGDVDQGALDALAAYCSAWSQWTEAQAKVKELGLVVKTPVGFAQENPYAVIARKANLARGMESGTERLEVNNQPGARIAIAREGLVKALEDTGLPAFATRFRKFQFNMTDQPEQLALFQKQLEERGEELRHPVYTMVTAGQRMPNGKISVVGSDREPTALEIKQAEAIQVMVDLMKEFLEQQKRGNEKGKSPTLSAPDRDK